MDDRDVEPPWFEWQPSAVPVFFHPTKRATSLPELKTPGQKVYALSWTPSQRSALWALSRARRHAVLADTEGRLGGVRKAVQTIPRAAAPACASGNMSASASKSTSPQIEVKASGRGHR
jgi:hypothetical protein